MEDSPSKASFYLVPFRKFFYMKALLTIVKRHRAQQ